MKMNAGERFTEGSKAPAEKQILQGDGQGSSHRRELQAYIAEACANAHGLLFYGKQQGFDQNTQ